MISELAVSFRAAVKLITMDRSDIHIVLIGDGQLKDDLKKKSENVPNIHFLDLMPKKDLVNYVKNAFVSLIPLNDTPMLATSSPNKLFESMAASVPVIQSTFGWIKEMLEQTQSGYTVSATDEAELVEKLIYLVDNETIAAEMGFRGYQYAKDNFDKDILAQKMLNGIVEVHNSN